MDELAVPQVLVAETVTFPDNEAPPQLVVMELLPWPEVIVTPAGTVQLKETPF